MITHSKIQSFKLLEIKLSLQTTIYSNSKLERIFKSHQYLQKYQTGTQLSKKMKVIDYFKQFQMLFLS